MDLLYNGAIRNLSFSGAIAYAFSNSFQTLEINVPCYTQTQSDARYIQQSNGFTLENSNGPELKIIARTSQSNIEFKGGTLRIRRESGSGSLNTHLQFPDTQNGNAFFFNSVTADAFQTSDNRLKDNQEDITTDEALSILQAVTPKKYTRNDKDNEPRHGFIAQELEAACSGHFACLVGTTEVIDDEIQPMKTVDYARLSAILWTVCRNLNSRLTDLETVNKSV